MADQKEGAPADEHGHDGSHGNEDVSISINGVTKQIHRGSHLVAEIKVLGGVPLADDLEQVIDGKLTPLPDDGRVTIKGGEIFVSHPKDSGSS
jgi:hypothetical protein